MTEIKTLRWFGLVMCGLTIVAGGVSAAMYTASYSSGDPAPTGLLTLTMVFLFAGLISTLSAQALAKIEARLSDSGENAAEGSR